MKIVNLSSFSNDLKLKMKWNEKKQAIAKEPLKLTKSKDIVINLSVSGLNKVSNNGLNKDQMTEEPINIIHKINMGAKLTREELENLRQNYPEYYKKAMEADKKRESYKQELENCDTQEEVDKVKELKAQEFYAKMQSVNQSGMSKETKEKVQLDLSREWEALSKEYSKFVSSGKYHALPSEKQEEREAEVKEDLNEKKEEDMLLNGSVSVTEEEKVFGDYNIAGDYSNDEAEQITTETIEKESVDTIPSVAQTQKSASVSNVSEVPSVGNNSSAKNKTIDIRI